MNLVIDIGNSSVKTGLFSGNTLVSHKRLEANPEQNIRLLLDSYPVDNILISSVNIPAGKFVSAIKRPDIKILILDEHLPLPVKNNYKTPGTLGADRLAGVIGAFYLSPGKPCMVIDAGTAVTYDFITADGEYTGGNISPGLRLRFQTLHEHTGQLPLVTPQTDAPLTGTDTVSAIRAGVQTGLLFEMLQYINFYSQKYPGLCTYLTGGDAEYFEKPLKNLIFVIPNLVLTGLNHILMYNLNEKTV